MTSNRAQTFFDTHVVPNWERWCESPLDVSCAMNLAVSLNQMADHFWYEYEETDPVRIFSTSSTKDFRKLLAQESRSFGLIRDVADAHKHVKLNRTDRALTSAGQTVIGAMGWGEAEYGVGIYGGAEELVVELDSGDRKHFSALASDVFVMWQSKLTNR